MKKKNIVNLNQFYPEQKHCHQKVYIHRLFSRVRKVLTFKIIAESIWCSGNIFMRHETTQNFDVIIKTKIVFLLVTQTEF